MIDPATLRKELTERLQVRPHPGPPAYTILQERDYPDYNEQLIAYHGHEGDEVKAFLLTPQGAGPFPGILLHHQHNSEWHLGKREVCGHAGNPLQAFGPHLVRRGFLVLAPDAIGFEDRRRHGRGITAHPDTDWLDYYNSMAYRLVQGKLLITTVLNDAFLAMSLLRSHPSCHASQTGAMGHSYGGMTTLFQAALDSDIQFSCSSGAAGSYRKKIEQGIGLEMSLIIPDILELMDMPDLLHSILPRKLLLVSGKDDKYALDAGEMAESLHRRIPNNSLVWKQFAGGHAITEERVEFILNWLTLQIHPI